jgi:chromosome segregation ATPase
MQLLEITFAEAKKPYDNELKRLQNEYANKKQEMQQKLNEIKHLKDDYKNLVNDLNDKTSELEQLNKDYEALRNDPKATQNSNRQFYTKRILEIVANIEKQKREIDKVIYLGLESFNPEA